MGITLWLLLACASPAPSDDTGAGQATLQTLDLARRIADKGVAAWPAEIQPGDWMQTVWAFGLLRLAEAGGGEGYRDYARAWMDEAVTELQAGQAELVSSDSTSPAIIAAALDEAAHAPLRDAADAYLAAVPLTSTGAWEHWTEEAAFGVPDQVWIDSQFMLGQYLLERLRHDPQAQVAGQPAGDLFTTQYLLFADLCRDDQDQLYRHAWDDVEGVNIPAEAVYWNRGNSWVLFVGVEALDVLGEGADPALAQAVAAHAAAVVDAQDPETGLWHTVLGDPRQDPDNYVETSGSALLAAALARGVRGGHLDPALGAAVAPAVEGVRAMIDDPDGAPVVTGTSFGTNPGQYEDYVGVPVVDDLILGVGAALVLLAEADGWPVDGGAP
ncbi:glycoside hydrolase family 88 protein [Myxococcota bacterium]|nr:glycoside hydrolase family 88 protein [Myxococcota bacterium]